MSSQLSEEDMPTTCNRIQPMRRIAIQPKGTDAPCPFTPRDCLEPRTKPIASDCWRPGTQTSPRALFLTTCSFSGKQNFGSTPWRSITAVQMIHR